MSKVMTFKVDLSKLSSEDKKVVKILTKVGNEVHKLWETQVNPQTGRVTVYDEGISREDIVLASTKNPEILSPYTVVRKHKDGSLYAVKYSQEYKAGIAKIVKLLTETVNATKDKHLKNYLGKIIKAYKKGNFDEALFTYLTNGKAKVSVLMGPIETYVDKLMGVKKFWQFNLRVLREDETNEISRMVEEAKEASVLKPFLSVGKNVSNKKVKIRVDDVLMFAGRQAGTLSASTNLPNEAEWVRKYGTKILLYQNALDYRFDNKQAKYLKVLKKVPFKINRKMMKDSSRRLILLHEITEALVKFDDAEERLGGNENAVRELNSYLMGVKSGLHHMLSGLISKEEYDHLLLMLIITGLDIAKRRDTDPSIYEYARGFAVVFNHLTKTNAVKIVKDSIEIDMERVAGELDNLASLVITILHEGSFNDSEKFFREYGSFDVLSKIEKSIKV